MDLDRGEFYSLLSNDYVYDTALTPAVAVIRNNLMMELKAPDNASLTSVSPRFTLTIAEPI